MTLADIQAFFELWNGKGWSEEEGLVKFSSYFGCSSKCASYLRKEYSNITDTFLSLVLYTNRAGFDDFDNDVTEETLRKWKYVPKSMCENEKVEDGAPSSRLTKELKICPLRNDTYHCSRFCHFIARNTLPVIHEGKICCRYRAGDCWYEKDSRHSNFWHEVPEYRKVVTNRREGIAQRNPFELLNEEEE